MGFPGATEKNTPDHCSRKGCAISRQSFFPCLQLLSQEIKITLKEVGKTERHSYLSNPLVSKPTAQIQFSVTYLHKSITDCLPGPAGPNIGFIPLQVSVIMYIPVYAWEVKQ